MTTLRPLTEADLADIAHIHVRIWQETYRGQMDQSYLDSLDPAAGLARWQEGYHKNKNNPDYGTLIARIDGDAVGFISYGPSRGDNAPSPFEIYAINILQAHTGQGLGYEMFQTVADILRHKGCTATYLWVLSTNENASRAYVRWGGKIRKDITKDLVIGPHTYTEYMVTFDL